MIGKTKPPRIREILDYVMLYLLLLSTSGFYFHSHIHAYIIPLGIGIVWCFFSGMKVNKTLFSVTVLLCFNILLSAMLNDDDLKSIFLAWAAVIGALLIVSSHDFEWFANSYCKLMAALSAFSIICYIIELFSPGLLANKFPLFQDNGRSAYYGIGAFVPPVSVWHAPRNQSIFWEPGTFQIFLIIAIVLDSALKFQNFKKRIIVYAIAVLTTLSSTGIIALFLATFIVLNDANQEKQFKSIRVLSLFLLVIPVLYEFFMLLPQDMTNNTFEKIADTLSGNTNNMSVSDRMAALSVAWSSFISSPIYGVGVKGMERFKVLYSTDIMTFTPGRWFANYGIISGILYNAGFSRILSPLYRSRVCNIAIAVLMMLIISSEAVTTNTAIIVFVMYGLVDIKNPKQINNTNQEISA